MPTFSTKFSNRDSVYFIGTTWSIDRDENCNEVKSFKWRIINNTSNKKGTFRVDCTRVNIVGSPTAKEPWNVKCYVSYELNDPDGVAKLYINRFNFPGVVDKLVKEEFLFKSKKEALAECDRLNKEYNYPLFNQVEEGTQLSLNV